jgi:hypothetical protein
MKLSDIQKEQEGIIASIYDCVPLDDIQSCQGILGMIQENDHADVVMALGTVGESLIRFSSLIDLTHPGLKTIFDGNLVSSLDESFSKCACDILKIVLMRKDLNLSDGTIAKLRRSIQQHLLYKTLNNIDDPIKTPMYTRFLQSNSVRNSVRAVKIQQTINVESICSKGMIFWEDHPCNFSCFGRNKNRFQLDIDEAVIRQKHFFNHGLMAMSQEIAFAAQELKNKAQENVYYGFNPITLNSVVVILAKLMGYQFETTKLVGGYPSEALIKIPKSMFVNCDVPSHDNENTFWKYQPVCYNLFELRDDLVNRIKPIIDFLDAFPESGHKPIFDHYRVVVPGIVYANEELKHKLDMDMLEKHQLIGVLLGETDGSHYFLSYLV